MAGSDNESDDASVRNEAINTHQQPNIQPHIITTISNNNAKFPYLKKDEYDVWAMKMEYWITNNDMNIWKVIQNGNSMKRTRRDRDGRVIILPPTTAEEHIAVQRESKARTTLLQFGRNAEPKKMRKPMLKQEFLKFRIGEAKGLHKGYDRMQKILSQLNQLKAKPEDEDINLKFLRASPLSCSQVALTLKTKGGLELLSFDDLYYKLKTLEVDVKGYTTFSSSQSGPSHSAFVSATSASKKMSHGDSPSYSSYTTYSAPSNSKTGSHRSDFKQIEKLDREEIELKWQMAMLYVRVHKFEQKAGRNIDFDKNESAKFNKKKVRCYKCQQRGRGHFARECKANRGNDKQRYSSFKIKEIGKKEEDSKALITVDTLVDWTYHNGESDGVIASKEFGMIGGCDTEDAIEEGAAKTYNLITGADTKEASSAGDAGKFALMGVTSEKKKRVLQRNQMTLEDKIRVLSIELENTSNLLKHSEKINADVETAKKDLQTKLDNHLVQTKKWRNSSKNLFRLIDSSMSVRTKVGLEFNNCIRENELGWDDSAFSVFTTTSEDVKGRPLFHRFAKGDSIKAVPPPLFGDYTSLSDHINLDESQMSYGTKSSTSYDSKSMSNDFVSCDDSDKSSEVNTNDFTSSVKYLEPKPNDSTSCASTSSVSTSVNEAEIESNIRTPIQEPIIVHDLPSFSCNSSDKNEHTSRTSCNKNGYFNKKAGHFRKNASSVSKLCFVCGSCTHLIKDYDFYEKQIANKTVGIRVGPIHSKNKVNHQNQFVPQAVLLRTSKVNIPPARLQPVPTGKPKVFAPVPTCLPNRHFPVSTDRGYSPSVSSDWWKNVQLLLSPQQVVLGNHIEKENPPVSLPVPTGSIPVPIGNTVVSTDDLLVHTSSSTDSFFDDTSTTRFLCPLDLGNHDPSPSIFSSSSYDDDFGAALNNVASTVAVSPVATTRINTIHPQSLIIGDPTSARDNHTDLQHCLFASFTSQVEPRSVAQALEDLSKYAIGTKCILKNKRDARGIVVRNKARLVAQGHRQEEGINYDEVFAHVTRIEAIRLFLAFASHMGFMVYQMDVKSAFLYGRINEEVYVTQPKGFVDPQHPKKVYKYVQEILNKFDLGSVRTATTPYEATKPKSKNESDSPINVHLYRSMIGSLMYLIALRPDTMFAVSACSRNQVTPTTSNLEKYLKGQPKLGLWCPKESPLVLEAYSDSDYARANKDRKSTTDGCQFLGTLDTKSVIRLWTPILLHSLDNVEDEPLVGSFHMSPPRSTPAPSVGQPSGGAEDPITLTALSFIVSTLVQKVHSLETELQDHKNLFKDVVGNPRVLADVPFSIAPAGISSKGKSPMVEEDIPVKARTFKQMEEDQLGEEAAKWLHDEEQAQMDRQRVELQRKRQHEVLDSAIYYNEADWINIRAQVEANASLSKTLLEEFEKIRKVQSNSQIQAFSRTLKRTGPVLEEPSSKRKKSTKSPIPSVPEVPQSSVVSSPTSSGTKKKSIGRKRITKPKSTLQELDLDADAQTLIKVVSTEDSDDEAPPVWSALVGWEVISTPLGDVNALYRIDQSTKHFTTLRQILHMVDRQDLVKLYGLVVQYYENHPVAGVGLILCVIFKCCLILIKEVLYMFTDVSYPLLVKIMQRMLTYKLEIDSDVVGNDMTTAEQLIQFIKNQLAAAQVSSV
nr:ribonuclease H-like domain, reverse transcriptase, RNA-dependent DNA polymerase [Tanacetum cinerariifolium]